MPTETLTAASIKAHLKNPPPSGRKEIYDAKVAGLCLRVSATGRGSWSFFYRPREGGGQMRLTLGTTDDLDLAAARQEAERHRLAVVVNRADPQRERQARRAAAANVLTFGILAQRYLDEYAKPRKASWRNDEIYLKRPRAWWGDRDAKTVTRRDVIALLDEIKHSAPVSANRTHSVLVTLFNWAVEDELVEVNPIAGMKKRAVEQMKDRVLTDAEIAVLWRALEGRGAVSVDVADALKLILLTGQRPGEVAGLRQSELDLLRPDPRWVIPAERMKARRAHLVPLAPMAERLVQDVLNRREADGNGVSVFASKFTSRATLARHSLSQGLGRVIARLDLALGEAARSLRENPPTPHDLRRSVATGLAALGDIPREDRKAVLAHPADDVHGRHYDLYDRQKEKRVALQKWERHLARVLGGAPESSAVVPFMRARTQR